MVLSIRFLIVTLVMLSAPLSAEPITRLLIIGNSITWHKPNDALGWKGNWGMAASRLENDFAHIATSILERIQEGQRPVLQVKNLSDFESNIGDFDFGRLKFVEEFQPDAVILFLGDNVRRDQYATKLFESEYNKILLALAGDSKRKLYCVSTWWASQKIDTVIHAACHSHDGRFVDIKEISELPHMRAASTGQYLNSGVAAHPSDKGMEAIAKRIINSMEEGR